MYQISGLHVVLELAYLYMYMLGNCIFVLFIFFLLDSFPTVPPTTGKRGSLTDKKHFIN